MRRAVVQALVPVLACLLAGCAAASETPDGAGGTTDPALGTLQGIVVDDAVRPVEGANVTASGAGTTLNTTTDDKGMFRFTDLQPGVYVVEVAKRFYGTLQGTVDVRAGIESPELARFQLNFMAAAVPYAELHKFEGMFECGFAVPGYATGGCANVNIVTGIMLCSYNLPCTNVTGDHSVELIWMSRHPDFIQSELVWEPTTATGSALNFGLGAATWQELQDGFADNYNYTWGEGPLMLTLQGQALEDSRIGIEERSLLIQVGSAWTTPIPVCSDVEPTCGVGVHAQQSYTTFTHAFHGYQPPVEWRFVNDGPPPPPPA